MMTDRSEADADIDPAALRRLFLRRWKTVLVTTIVGGALAFAVLSLRPREYEASVQLAVSGPVMPAGASAASMVRTALTAAAPLAKVSASLPGDTPVDPDNIHVDPVPNTPIVRVRVRDRDPSRASVTAARLGQEAVALSRLLDEQAAKPSKPVDRSRLETADTELRRTELQLLEFQERSDIEFRRRERQAYLDRRLSGIDLDLRQQEVQARLEAALSGLAEASKARPSTSGGDGTEALTHAYARVAAESRAQLAALRVQRSAARELPKDQSRQLRELELQLKRMEQEYEVARAAYRDELVRMRQAQTPAVPRASLVDTEPPVATPLPRDRVRVTILAAMVSLLAGVAIAIVAELVGSARPPSESAS